MSSLSYRDRPSRISKLVRGAAAAIALSAGLYALPAAAATTTLPPSTTAPPASTTTTTVAPPSLDAIGRALRARGASAVSVAVWKNGAFVFTGTWGAANPGSRFQLASISKMLAAMATERLVEQGKVDLDATVAPALAAAGLRFAPGWGVVTVRQLLSHTSGAPQAEDLFFGKTAAPSCETAAAFVLANNPVWTPGTKFTYSNASYCLLGIYLKVVTGRSYDALINDLVWAPAGVKGPHLASTGVRSKGDVAYAASGRRFLEALGAAGRWMASPSEVVKAVATITPAERAALLTWPAATKGEYGLGVRLQGDGSWGHTGTLEAARTCVWVEPDGTVWAVFVSGKTPVNGSALRAKYLPTIQRLVAG